MKIIAIYGSLREKSYNRSVLEYLAELAQPKDTLEIFPTKEIPLFCEDYEPNNIPEGVLKLKNLISDSDGVILATSEYNNIPSAVLLNILNWLSRASLGEPIKGKPVGIVGASTSGFGTARAQLVLRAVLSVLDAKIMNRPTVPISKAQEKFNSSGKLVDVETQNTLKTFWNSFLHFCGK